MADLGNRNVQGEKQQTQGTWELGLNTAQHSNLKALMIDVGRRALLSVQTNPRPLRGNWAKQNEKGIG